MKLVLLTNHLPPYRMSTLAALRKKVDKFTVVLSSEDYAPGLPELDIGLEILPNFQIKRQRTHENGYAEKYKVAVPYGVVSALRRIDPDVVLSAEYGLRTAYASIWRLLSGKALVTHADLSEEYEQGRDALRMTLRRTLLKASDHVVSNGRSGSRYVQSLGYPGDRITISPYPTDIDHFGQAEYTRTDDGVIRMVYVGQLIERKGLTPFITLLGELLAKRPQTKVVLTLAGDGDRRAEIAALPVPPNLTLDIIGPVKYAQLSDVYGRAQVFVIPTLGDTWALVVNEAMASGLPVLGTTQSQAVLEIVEDGRQGWVYDARSRDSAISAIERCLSSTFAERIAMGHAARKVALDHTPERAAQELYDACRLAMQRRHR